MFGEDILEDSQVELKKGDIVQSRLSQRIGRIMKTYLDMVHVDVRWEGGAEQKVAAAQLIKINDPRYKSANGHASMLFEEALKIITSTDDISSSVRNAEFAPFSRREILEIGDIMREAGLHISPDWIEDELKRRGFRIVI